MNNENRLRIENRVIRRYLSVLGKAGFQLQVDYGEGEFPVTTNIGEALDQIRAVDEARVYVIDEDRTRQGGWLFFVMGNAPGEVLNDYTTNLEDIIAPANKFAERWA